MNTNKATTAPCHLIQALCESVAYHHEVASVQLIETHISWVLLTGEYAYKIKKPVNFGFLDFSTLEKRLFFCQEELRLNARLAANWYLGVVPITGSIEHPEMDGTGAAIEYAVKMRQFSSIQTLRESASNGNLEVGVVDQIVEIVADFHTNIRKTDAESPYGALQDIQHWSTDNFDHIRPLLNDSLQLQQLKAIETWSKTEAISKSIIMEQRKQQGYVRECHGDLHLGNMTFIDGNVVLFDCIEFNPLLHWIDVISEVAFLVMDLIHFGYDQYAYRFLNRYLQKTGDYQGLSLLRYYLVYRALVRAKVALLRVAQHPDAAVCKQARSEYVVFANLAQRFTKTNKPMLIITHGFSGSGKSTIAGQLAEALGALQIRSDIERKRLFGYQAQDKTGSDLSSGVYTHDAGQQTYLRLVELAQTVLEANFTAIVDATFLKSEDRSLFQQLASEHHVPFIILDFQASAETLSKRIEQRQGDASEATIAVLHQQQQLAEPLSNIEQAQVISVDTENDNTLALLQRIKSILPTHYQLEAP